MYLPGAKMSLVLSAGRLWDKAKNLTALDTAAQGLPWPVFVAGDNTAPEGSVVEGRHVKMLGALGPQALAEWYGQASIYCLPARYEPFGLSVL